MAKDNAHTDAEHARAMLEADKQARAQEAIRRIDEICKELRVQLVPVYLVRNGQGSHTVEVAPLD